MIAAETEFATTALVLALVVLDGPDLIVPLLFVLDLPRALVMEPAIRLLPLQSAIAMLVLMVTIAKILFLRLHALLVLVRQLLAEMAVGFAVTRHGLVHACLAGLACLAQSQA
jgi:hypothetical protein